MRRILTLISGVSVAVLGVALVACGSDADEGDSPQVVVTTNILGDIVSEAVGDLADVEVIMPLGSDPHDFAPSARQAEMMENADLLVVNGAGFEAGMLDIIDNVDDSGTAVFTFADQVELLDSTDDPGAGDPHIWTDPTRIITGVDALGGELSELEGFDAAVLSSRVDAYVAELAELDGEIETMLASIPDDQRRLVTNHEVLAYFAERFAFEVIGAVIPSLTTDAEPSAVEIEELAELIAAEGVPAIFAETTGSTRLAEVLAEEAGGDISVVELFTESLGEAGSGAETYLTMMRANATLVADALAPS